MLKKIAGLAAVAGLMVGMFGVPGVETTTSIAAEGYIDEQPIDERLWDCKAHNCQQQDGTWVSAKKCRTGELPNCDYSLDENCRGTCNAST